MKLGDLVFKSEVLLPSRHLGKAGLRTLALLVCQLLTSAAWADENINLNRESYSLKFGADNCAKAQAEYDDAVGDNYTYLTKSTTAVNWRAHSAAAKNPSAPSF